MEEKTNPVQHIRFDHGDEEEGRVAHERALHRHRRLSRQSSVGSLSIHSAGGGTRTVQPETALPITYRTLSIEVDEDLHQKQSEVKRAKEKGAVDLGGLEWYVKSRFVCDAVLFHCLPSCFRASHCFQGPFQSRGLV
jgi:sodium/potassium-transporting ATPase subunit alpha